MRANCVAVSRSDGRLVGDRLSDVSWDGAFLEGGEEAALGDTLKLRVQIPGSRVWMDAEATVTRVSRGRRGPGDRPGVGVTLSRMDGMSRVMLATVAKSFPVSTGAGPRQTDYASIVQTIGAA